MNQASQTLVGALLLIPPILLSPIYPSSWPATFQPKLPPFSVRKNCRCRFKSKEDTKCWVTPVSSSLHSVCFHFTHIPLDFLKGYFPINSPLDLLLAIRQDSWFLQIVSPIHNIKIFCLVTPHPLSWDNTLWLCCTFQCTFLLLIRPPSSKKGWCSQSMLTSSAPPKISQIPKVPRGCLSVHVTFPPPHWCQWFTYGGFNLALQEWAKSQSPEIDECFNSVTNSNKNVHLFNCSSLVCCCDLQ